MIWERYFLIVAPLVFFYMTSAIFRLDFGIAFECLSTQQDLFFIISLLVRDSLLVPDHFRES